MTDSFCIASRHKTESVGLTWLIDNQCQLPIRQQSCISHECLTFG